MIIDILPQSKEQKLGSGDLLVETQLVCGRCSSNPEEWATAWHRCYISTCRPLKSKILPKNLFWQCLQLFLCTWNLGTPIPMVISPCSQTTTSVTTQTIKFLSIISYDNVIVWMYLLTFQATEMNEIFFLAMNSVYFSGSFWCSVTLFSC